TQASVGDAATSPGRALLPNRPEDERAIQSVTSAFTRAYRAGDAQSVASLFTEDAEIVDEKGARLRGRPMIEDAFTSLFQGHPRASIEVFSISLRFLGPDVAQEEGRTRVRTEGQEPATSLHYTALLVKQKDGWRYSRVREQHETGIGHHEQIKELEWLVGD